MGFSPSTTAPRRVAFSEKHSYHRIPSADSARLLFTHHEGIDRSSSSSTIERNRLWTQEEEPDLEKNHEYAKKKSRSFPCHNPDRRNFDSGGDSFGGRKNGDSSRRSSSWSSWESLHNRVKENIQNSWHLGFLWPDEEDGLEFLEQDRKSTCSEHDDDDENHDLIHSQQKQEQQQQQQQQHEEMDSLLQNSSTKFGGFASPNYGTWLSSTATDQQFNMRGGTPRFALGSLQADHSHTLEEHESSPSVFSNILDKTPGIMKHSQSAPSFVVADEEDDDNTTATQETNGTRTTPSDDDFDLRIHVPGRSGWDDTDKLPSSLQYPSSTRAFPSTPKSAKISALTPTKSMPAAMHRVKVVKKKNKCLHRCNTAPAMSAPATAAATAKNADDNNNNSDVVKRPHLSKSGSIVLQAGLGLMVYLAVGVLIYTWKRKEFSGLETVSYVDALYFCIVTMCTIGYGDITPTTTSAKLFACGFVLIGFGFIDALLSGMVNYVLDKQEHLLLSAVEGSHYQVARKYFMNPNHGNRIRIRMKVALAAGVPVLCIIVGTIVMMQMEKLSWIDALYCTTMSITTVGYGDHTFKSFTGRLFAAVWLLFSTLAVARCFLYLTEARVEKRHRAIAKWVLRRQFSVGDLIKADLDHDGCIRYLNPPFFPHTLLMNSVLFKLYASGWAAGGFYNFHKQLNLQFHPHANWIKIGISLAEGNMKNATCRVLVGY